MKLAFYKTTRPGFKGIYSRLVRFWTKSPYSHVELIFRDGMSASSSWEDKGVRFKKIDFDPEHWDFITLPEHLEDAAHDWFVKHQSEKYDLWGNAHFIIGGIGDDKDRWFCSEACGVALGLPEAWRFDPATLAAAAQLLADNTQSLSLVKTA